MSDCAVTLAFDASTDGVLDAIKDVVDAVQGLTELTGQLSESLQGKDAVAMGALHAQLVAMSTASTDAVAQVLLEFKDVIGGAAKIVADLASSFTGAMESGGQFKAILDLVADGLKVLISFVSIGIAAVKEMWYEMSLGVEAIGNLWPRLGSLIGDVFTDLNSGIAKFFGSLIAAASEATASVGQAFTNVGAVIKEALHGNLSEASADFAKLKNDAAAAGTSVNNLLKASVSGFNFSDAEQEFSKYIDDIKGSQQDFTTETVGNYRTMMSELNTIWGNGSKSVEATTSKTSADIAAQTGALASAQVQQTQAAEAQKLAAVKTGATNIEDANQQSDSQVVASHQRAADQSFAIEIRSISAQIKAIQDGLRAKQTVLNAEVAQHQITQDQKFAALEAETQKEYQAELALLQKELALGELRASQAQAIENRIAALRQKNDLEMVKLDEQSIAAAQNAWNGYFNTLEGAFNSQISGLIKGTTSWSQAFKSVLTDLLVRFIEMAEKMAFQWAASEIAQTTATTSGAAARAAANSGAAAASSAGAAATVLRSIAASAAETFAGIFGFLSPVMGPAAAGPAAAGQATVAAAAGGVGAFAQGSWALPADMIAQVHKGEMIVPAAQTPWAQSLMANASRAPASPGGDVHVHHATNFNVTALDSRDVKRWISGNGKTILDTINGAVRDGAHLGLSKLAGA